MTRPLTPVLISDDTIEHIHSHSGRGHISGREIREVLENASSVKKNRKDATGDVIVEGQASNGKKLLVYVKFIDDPTYYTEVCTARSVKRHG